MARPSQTSRPPRSQKRSAGLLLYRRHSALEVFLVHPGGPFWTHRDAGAWTLPKGELLPGENPLATAQREFQEETGFALPSRSPDDYLPLGTIRQLSGKLVHGWAAEGNCDPAALQSNLTEVEYPPRSGRKLTIPEVDRGAWFTMPQAQEKILPAQALFLTRLEETLARHS
ncbi:MULTISPECIES: NUDIX domain-containing protein [Acidobacterium]|uniref:Hydrolase, NUDIX family n=1 Tax=Acidobacterium capsulatum (strain ATCC 51196 / DSM 11244 / BCRC 80197 / JCM 7670 / NBRC 15755 / NCIMB 13165 / 161) TaxID=240015 RepID=C1F3Z6_ACIC5|nr:MULTISPECIES: NUDIX domain-containing protein [Acidobacterium]ACO33256.1 hydrolase, NUDIX family [Acidobacterium capsulatum ATCC 51196]HCT61725.1 NUDIX domain-containing protein [Acidobacterium sp.]